MIWTFLFLAFSHIICFASSKTIETNKIFTTTQGFSISLSEVQKYLPNAGISDLSYIIFEYDASQNSLSSRNETIQLPPPNSRISFPSAPIPFSINGKSQRPSVSKTKFYKSVSGHNFLFESENNGTLISAWGPSLFLHPLNHPENKNLFINSLGLKNQRNAIFEGRTITPLERQVAEPVSCSIIYRFELGLAYDASFCSLFGNNYENVQSHIQALIFDVSTIFRSTVCVSLVISYIDAYCSNDILKDDKFNPPLDLNSSDSSLISRRMLQLVSREWNRGVSGGAHRDAAFLFTGYSDNTPLAGATYRAQACNERLSFAWIEKATPLVLAHEIGHMLGAKHAEEGIMKSRVIITDNLMLSRNSQIEIRRFLERDSRSWCLKRNGNSFGRLQQIYKWSYTGSFLKDPKQNTNVSDITFADINGDNKRNDLISLVTEKDFKNGFVKATYRVAYDVKCDTQGFCSLSKESVLNRNVVRKIDLDFTPNSYGFGISFGHLKDVNSNDIVISHLKPFTLGNGEVRVKPVYRIGYGLGTEDSQPIEWSGEDIEVARFVGENVQCAGISLAHIRSNERNDLVYVQIDRKKHRNVLTYQIGFNMSPSGKILDGWTVPIEVDGWYGKDTTGVSAAVADIDKNGVPDLILYHVDNTPTFKIGYIRVGKDLDKSTGKVTGGWTDFVRAAILIPFNTRRSGSMDISLDIEGNSGIPVVATAQREYIFHTNIPQSWTMYFGGRVLTENLMRTSKERPLLEDLSQGCGECYAFAESKQCKTDLSRCQSMIEEVNLDEQDAKEDIQTPFNSPNYRGNSTEKQNEKDSEFIHLPNRPKSPKTDSIFCAGFHYLYTNRGGCDVIDRITVFAKGLEQVFLEEISKEVDVADIVESRSSFEDPYGTYNGKPIAVQAKINGNKVSYNQAIKNAFRKLEKKVDFNIIINPLKDIKRSANKSPDGKHWIVRFYFAKNIVKEI